MDSELPLVFVFGYAGRHRICKISMSWDVSSDGVVFPSKVDGMLA